LAGAAVSTEAVIMAEASTVVEDRIAYTDSELAEAPKMRSTEEETTMAADQDLIMQTARR